MSALKKIDLYIHSHIDNLDEDGITDEAPEINDSRHSATMRTLKDEIAFSYEEKGEGGTVFCDILVKGERVTVSRRGAIKSIMLFEEGKIHTTVYEIPPYKFDMSIKTRRLKNTLTESGGILDMLYEMSVGGAAKRCRMKITTGEKP